MPTKAEYGLGVLYHATPAQQKARAILSEGIKPIGGIIWLAYDKEDAYRSAIDHMDYASSITVFAVNLPSNWELEKLETGVYGSRKAIPRSYLRRL